MALADHLWELNHEVSRYPQPERAKACLAAMSGAAVHSSAVQSELADLLAVLGEQPTMAGAMSEKALSLVATLRWRPPRED